MGEKLKLGKNDGKIGWKCPNLKVRHRQG